jgi:hypothetical protein
MHGMALPRCSISASGRIWLYESQIGHPFGTAAAYTVQPNEQQIGISNVILLLRYWELRQEQRTAVGSMTAWAHLNRPQRLEPQRLSGAVRGHTAGNASTGLLEIPQQQELG